MADGTPIIIKKKKSHGHGHHGGAWKVAYADFVTAMMAFFMVMWIMGMSQETRSMIQGYFNDPIGFTKNEPKTRVNIQPTNGSPLAPAANRNGAGSAEKSTEQKLVEAVQAQVKSAINQEQDETLKKLYKESIEMKVTNEGLELEFVEGSGSVFFEIGSAAIRPGAANLIKRIAPILAKTGRPIQIDGHTDARPFASGHYSNWELSCDRARSMLTIMMASGVPDKQFFSVNGHGSKMLKRIDDPNHFSNRRVNVLLRFSSPGGDQTVMMPKDILNDQIQGAFRRPPNLAPQHKTLRP